MAAITPETRSRLLREFNGRPVPYRQDRTVLGLFEDQARQQPDAPAVTFGDRTLSYGLLNRHANALADRLSEAGVGRGDFVPLVLRNGLELPLSMLALMKLAAPFVPLDDLWPADRLDRIIDTVEPKVVVTTESGARRLSGIRTLVVELDSVGESDSDDHGVPAGMDDIIYGFYTSGSTGVPKCTLNIHRGLLNRFGYMTRAFSDRTDEVVLQNSKPAFDSSLWQLLWPLTTGSQVIIPDREGILDLTTTMALIRDHGVTMTDFVPSIFTTLVEMLDARPELPGRLVSLRRLLIGGEEINIASVQRFRKLLPRVRITNTYGPTEASIGSVFHDVTDADADSIPIGRPIDNTYAVVLDENRDLVPVGTHGEIHIAGDCLGSGYLHAPEKTAAAFVENPFPEIPGPLLYRTGDIGYVRPDGLLGFVGRRDNQVKVGGIRVELSEIEVALLSHAQVLDAKVVLAGTNGSARLVAFLTHRDEPSTAELRRHAQELLPPYLVPKQFLLLDRMPLTPNGKADRRRLAELAAEQTQTVEAGQLGDPRQVISAIWRNLLAEPVSQWSADFFAHGGDSLSAQRLALALSEQFGLRVTVRDVVNAPTIDEQAALVAGAPGRKAAMDDLAADIALPEAIAGDRPPAPSRLDDVLLTGATGFIGAQLLHDLLVRTGATVHCVVRAADAVSAAQRIAQTLRTYQLWDPAMAGRIVAIPGDLQAERFGLTEREYAALAARIDAIVHNGAVVNLLLGYGAHRPANVTGTVNVLRLASTTTTKPVHFVSTLGTVPADAARGFGGRFPEMPVPADWAPVDGYSQSKWVSERLLRLAQQRGIPVAVYRLGEVMPHSTTGVPNPRALMELLVHACLEVGGRFPSPIVTDYTPVDRVSELVVAGLTTAATGHFHVLAPQSVSFDDVLSAFAPRFDLRPMNYTDFWQALRAISAERSEDVALRGALALLPPPGSRSDSADVADQLADLLQDNTILFETARAEELALRAGIRPLGSADPAVLRYADHHGTRVRVGEWARAAQ